MPPCAEYFVCRLYDDMPGPTTNLPGNLREERSIFDYLEEYDSECDQYHYVANLPSPLFLDADETYWLSLQAVLCFPPNWGWCECDSDYYWGSEAFMDYELIGIPRWTSMTVATGSYFEMAFVLHGPTASGVELPEYVGWGRIKALYR